MTAREQRLSAPTLNVLHLYVTRPHMSRAGTEIAKAAGISAGTLYPLLGRLEASGWLESNWENVDPKSVGRPRRRFHRMTDLGLSRARKVLAELQLPISGAAVTEPPKPVGISRECLDTPQAASAPSNSIAT